MLLNSHHRLPAYVLPVMIPVFLLLAFVLTYRAVNTKTDVRTKAAQEFTVLQSWGFSRNLEGWSGTNIVHSSLDSGSWRFQLGGKDSILSTGATIDVPYGNKYIKLTLSVSSESDVCDRCSTVYDKQRTKYISDDCSQLPKRENGTIAEERITRVFDSSCHISQGKTCTRCSTAVDSQRVWWKQVGGDCSMVPLSESLILRTADSSCKVAKTGSNVCNRCSTTYAKQRVSYVSKDCSILPKRSDGSVAEEKITRIYDPTCSPNIKTCTRCSTAVDKQRVWWKKIDDSCGTIPKNEGDILRTADISCTVVYPTSKPGMPFTMQVTAGSLRSSSISIHPDGKMHTYTVPFSNPNATKLVGLRIQIPSDAGKMVVRIEEIALLMKSTKITPVSHMCDRCSVVYDNMRVKYLADNCNDLPITKEQQFAEDQVTRVYDSSCHANIQESCTRCSTAVDKQRVWWIKVPGKGCSDSPADLPKKSDGSIDESKIVRKADPACKAITNEVVFCDRCSTTYDQMKVKYRGDCSVLPKRSDGSFAEEQITRVYDPNCHDATQATCTRCSTATSGQRVWWMRVPGKGCSDSVDDLPKKEDGSVDQEKILRTPDGECKIQ